MNDKDRQKILRERDRLLLHKEVGSTLEATITPQVAELLATGLLNGKFTTLAEFLNRFYELTQPESFPLPEFNPDHTFVLTNPGDYLLLMAGLQNAVGSKTRNGVSSNDLARFATGIRQSLAKHGQWSSRNAHWTRRKIRDILPDLEQMRIKKESITLGEEDGTNTPQNVTKEQTLVEFAWLDTDRGSRMMHLLYALIAERRFTSLPLAKVKK